MTGLVVELSQPEGNGVVELLERYLERARAGEFSAIAVTSVDREGVSEMLHSVLPSISTMVGALERAKLDIIMEADHA